MLIDSLFLVNKQHDTFAELAIWKAASDDTSLFTYLFQPPTTMLFFLPLLVASLLIFIHFWNSWSIWPRSWMFAFPRILEAPGYFAPRTQLKSAPAQTRWLRSRSGPSLLLSTIWRSQVWEPSQHRAPLLVHAKTGALLLGGSTPMASQIPKEKLIFIFRRSNSCLVKSVSEMQIWRREHSVC